MKVWVPTFFLLTLVASDLWAADPLQLALMLKAQTDFEKVQLAALPPLADIGNCVQSQAAVISVSLPEDAAVLYFRRGYCVLAGAAITGSAREYLDAAADFDRAIEAWRARVRKLAKKQPAEPISSALVVLPAIARLHGSTDAAVRTAARGYIADAVSIRHCTSTLIPDGQ